VVDTQFTGGSDWSISMSKSGNYFVSAVTGLAGCFTSIFRSSLTRVHSAACCLGSDGSLVTRAPFRAPHHRASIVALVGGGSWSLRPGEVRLATYGVDECPLRFYGDSIHGAVRVDRPNSQDPS